MRYSKPEYNQLILLLFCLVNIGLCSLLYSCRKLLFCLFDDALIDPKHGPIRVLNIIVSKAVVATGQKDYWPKVRSIPNQ